MTVHKTCSATTLSLLLAATLSVASENHAFVGPRAASMGGANTASSIDSTAIWHNPATFGFMNAKQETPVADTNAAPESVAVTNEPMGIYSSMAAAYSATNALAEASETKPAEDAQPVLNAMDNNGLGDRTFGWSILDIGFGYTMTENMGRYVDILADIDFDSFDTGTLGTSENVDSLLKLGSALYGIDNGQEGLYADYSAGTSFRFGHIGLGLRSFGELAAWVNDIDTANLGLDQSPADLVDDLNNAAGSDAGFTASGTFSTLTTDQRDALAAQLGVANTDSSIEYIDFKLTKLKKDGTLTQSDIDNAVSLLTDLNLDGSGSISSNQTTVIGRGFNVVEIPFSYGRAISKNLSVGVTAKAMFGSVLGTKIWVFNENNVDDAFENASDNHEETLTVGLDLGVLYRIPNFQFAVVGHNLNRPTFKGFTDAVTIEDGMGNVLSTATVKVPDVEIDPQITLGAAFIPSERLTLGGNYELLETGTILNGYDIQRISFGGELDVWLVALRLGAYKNLAEDWEEWVATAGVGFNLFGVRFDVGGAYSLGENAEYDGNDIPTVARAHAGFSLDY